MGRADLYPKPAVPAQADASQLLYRAASADLVYGAGLARLECTGIHGQKQGNGPAAKAGDGLVAGGKGHLHHRGTAHLLFRNVRPAVQQSLCLGDGAPCHIDGQILPACPTQDSGKGEIWHGQLAQRRPYSQIRVRLVKGVVQGASGQFHRDSGRLFRPRRGDDQHAGLGLESLVQELVEIRRSHCRRSVSAIIHRRFGLQDNFNAVLLWQCQATVNDRQLILPDRTGLYQPQPQGLIPPCVLCCNVLPLLAVQLLICVCGFPHLTDQATGRDFVLVNRRQLL